MVPSTSASSERAWASERSAGIAINREGARQVRGVKASGAKNGLAARIKSAMRVPRDCHKTAVRLA
eukprot:15444051-Alexandrium_andersonii.AAC.2